MILIDADEMIFKYGDWYVEEGSEEGFIGTVEQLVEMIQDAQPTAQLEIIRCKDCEYYDDTNTDFRHCEVLYDGDGYMMTTEPDDFCSYGERKE